MPPPTHPSQILADQLNQGPLNTPWLKLSEQGEGGGADYAHYMPTCTPRPTGFSSLPKALLLPATGTVIENETMTCLPNSLKLKKGTSAHHLKSQL